jgi:Uma2 family endonuclease
VETENTMLPEITLPERKPALEWILGTAVQKVSPQRPHALLQAELGRRLIEWARGRGEVGSEWRFRIGPPGEVIRPLVPDLAYLSYDRMSDATDEELRAPRVPPDVAVEIRSPDDRDVFLDHKIGVYLAAGTALVLVVDPESRTLVAYDRDGSRLYAQNQTFAHPALPAFTVPLGELFAILHRPGGRKP